MKAEITTRGAAEGKRGAELPPQSVFEDPNPGELECVSALTRSVETILALVSDSQVVSDSLVTSDKRNAVY